MRKNEMLKEMKIGIHCKALLFLFMVFSMQQNQANQMLSNIKTLPGADAFSLALTTKLTAALAKKDKQYRPRTRHLNQDGSAKYSNRLLLEPSPYLQQHAHNPVNWYPWSGEAFDEARRLNRPLLVSIGYSTCHWCHVMEEESYDDLEIAKYVNKNFIAIKVDRESRPDVDEIYMRAVQAMTGQGGWPLNVFLLPNKKAFYGGTYFPPKDVAGRPGLETVLRSINQAYHNRSEEINDYARKLTAAIQTEISARNHNVEPEIEALPIAQAVQFYRQNIDPEWGGVGKGIKFPSNTPIRLLLQEFRRKPDEPLLNLITLTLDKMARGGIYDQLAGGFHRYSTDRQWQVPHFEKMLYDNARLVQDYLAAWQVIKKPLYKQIVEETLEYIQREMTAPEGGFYSATDADSLNDSGAMEEGSYFTWTKNELDEILDKNVASIVADWFAVTQQGSLDGRNVLHIPIDFTEFSKKQPIKADELQAIIRQGKVKLLAARKNRKPPLRDDKIITAWNGQMITAFAKASFVLNRPDFLNSATQGAQFILRKLANEERLNRIYFKGEVQETAFLNDYVFVIEALLELYQFDANPLWLKEARKLQIIQDKLFLDRKDGVYFNTALDAEKMLFRIKPTEDGVLPSGNSTSAINLLRLFKLTGDESYHVASRTLMKAMSPQYQSNPIALNEMLISLGIELSNGKEVVLMISNQAENTNAMLQVLRENYLPESVILLINQDVSFAAHAEVTPLLSGKKIISGKTTAYVCKNKSCQLPTVDQEIFIKQLLQI